MVDKNILITLPEELLEKIDEQAEKDSRSRKNWIEVQLEKIIKKIDKGE